MSNTMAATKKAPAKTITYAIEYLFNDGGKFNKREELSPTKGIPHEFLEDFAVGDLVSLQGCTEEDAKGIFEAMLTEITENEAVYVEKEFSNGATFTIEVDILADLKPKK